MELFTALVYIGIAFVLYKLLDLIIRLPRVSGISDKYILITGCDTGFGHETAKRLDRLGCHVFAACLTERGEEELRKQCSSRMRTLYMDVSVPESVQKAYEQVEEALPQGKGLWAVLNNAGILGILAPDEWLHLKDYQRVLDVNLLGLINVTLTFLPLVKRGGGGRVVNTASMAARCAFPHLTPYCISKYGVEAFSDSLRIQLKLFNVSVHMIEPGGYKTGISDRGKGEAMIRQAFSQAPEAVKQEYGEEYLETMVSQAERQEAAFLSKRITDVVDAYVHALLGRHPRARYHVGIDAKMLIPFSTIMPEWCMDWIIRTAYREVKPRAVREAR